MGRNFILAVALVLVVCAQAGFSWSIRDLRPTMGILPDLPQERAVAALALGDEQFLFRYLALNLQNAGDNGGRITPLKNYDYEKVAAWLVLLDDLDLDTYWTIAMANGYFGQTQNTDDVRYIVQYMQAHVAQRPQAKWPWLVNAIYLSRHRLKSDWLALDAARQLATYDFADMNVASLQMPALVLDDLGQLHKAIDEIESLRKRRGTEFSFEEHLWMRDFVASSRQAIVDPPSVFK